MKSAKLATIVSTLLVILLEASHACLARVVVGGVGKNGAGVELPQPVVVLIKLDHFFEDYFYVLIPFLWLITFGALLMIRACFSGVKPAGGQP